MTWKVIIYSLCFVFGLWIADITYPKYTKTSPEYSTFQAKDTVKYGYKQDKGIILLTFNGYISRNTIYGNNIFLPCLLLDKDRLDVQKKVGEYYDVWDVIITQDDSLFYSFPKSHRIRCVITSTIPVVYTWGGFYLAGGISRYNSLYIKDTTPCVVSPPLIGENVTYIATVIAHETAHCLGLAHQALFANGEIQDDYDPGNEDSIPIMGGNRKGKKRYWTKGINAFLQEQDDTLLISKTFRRIYGR